MVYAHKWRSIELVYSRRRQSAKSRPVPLSVWLTGLHASAGSTKPGKETKVSLNRTSVPELYPRRRATACRTPRRQSKACCDPCLSCLRNHIRYETGLHSLLEAHSTLTATGLRDGAVCDHIWTHRRSQQLRDRYACIILVNYARSSTVVTFSACFCRCVSSHFIFLQATSVSGICFDNQRSTAQV